MDASFTHQGHPNTIIAVTTEKGGVGKTTTATNLAHALSLAGRKTLLVDMDPQGNATQGLGFKIEEDQPSVADLLWDKTIPTGRAIRHRGTSGPGQLDVIAANSSLARVARGLVTLTNAELRLAQRLRSLRSAYDYIIIDSAPNFGPILNSVLNAANFLIVPVDSNYYALMGLQRLLAEVEDIRSSNPNLVVMGYLMTMVDRTIICGQTTEAVTSNFGGLVFGTKIRRAVSLREAPTLGQTIFEYAPESTGADDYRSLSLEVMTRIRAFQQNGSERFLGPVPSYVTSNHSEPCVQVGGV